MKLFLVKVGGTGGSKLGNAVLAAKVGGGLEIEYVLTKSVTQAPDPTALPAESELKKAILERAQSVLESQLKEV